MWTPSKQDDNSLGNFKSYKHKYSSMKANLKEILYENELIRDELRKLQRELLDIYRDKETLLEQVLQSENFDDEQFSSSSDLDDQQSDNESIKIEPPPMAAVVTAPIEAPVAPSQMMLMTTKPTTAKPINSLSFNSSLQTTIPAPVATTIAAATTATAVTTATIKPSSNGSQTINSLKQTNSTPRATLPQVTPSTGATKTVKKTPNANPKPTTTATKKRTKKSTNQQAPKAAPVVVLPNLQMPTTTQVPVMQTQLIQPPLQQSMPQQQPQTMRQQPLHHQQQPVQQQQQSIQLQQPMQHQLQLQPIHNRQQTRVNAVHLTDIKTSMMPPTTQYQTNHQIINIVPQVQATHCQTIEQLAQNNTIQVNAAPQQQPTHQPQPHHQHHHHHQEQSQLYHQQQQQIQIPQQQQQQQQHHHHHQQQQQQQPQPQQHQPLPDQLSAEELEQHLESRRMEQAALLLPDWEPSLLCEMLSTDSSIKFMAED